MLSFGCRLRYRSCGTVLGEMACGNIQIVCAFPIDLGTPKSIGGAGYQNLSKNFYNRRTWSTGAASRSC
jgi:hypothetical protein